MIRNILFIIGLAVSFILPTSAQNHFYHKGNTYYEMKDFQGAIASYLEHLKLNPNDKLAFIKLAESHEHIYDWDNAAKWYYEALGQSVSTEYLLRHGLVQMKLGRYEAAKQQFMTYASVNPTIGQHYAKMCDFAYNKKNTASLYTVNKWRLSSQSSDFSPCYGSDGIVFVSGRKDIVRADALNGAESANDKKYNFIFKTDPTGTRKPDYLRPWFRDNDLQNEGPLSYSADGQWVAFVENDFVDGISQMSHDLYQGSIFIARVGEGGDWETASAFPYNGDFSNHYPHLSADGNILYFSSNRPGGQGGYDIYMSEKKNGAWQQPKNLGTTINKPGNEITPFMDGTDFYFSSDYQVGMGGQDVFKANFANGLWTVQHLGNGVNSSANDFGFIFQKKNNSGFFVSDRDGNEDIFSAMKTSDDINIIVRDALTKAPIDKAVLDFKNCGKSVFFTNEEGRFGFQTKDNLDCWIAVHADGYERTRLTLDKDSKSKGILEVLLFKSGESYTGKVTDGTSDANLKDVRVRVLNQKTGKRYDVYSDNKGIYTLALEPNTSYMIQFTNVGYVAVSTKIETGDGSDKGVLGSQLMFPTTNTGGPSVPTVPSPSPEIEPIVEVPTSPTTPTVPTPPSPQPIPPPTSPSAGVPSVPSAGAGFSVQLMSLSKSNSRLPSNIKSLKGMVDRVYVKTDEKYKRYRIGTYKTRAEAENIKAYVRAVGFEGAFVVEEDNKGLIEVLDL